jgi:hypothetical protein
MHGQSHITFHDDIFMSAIKYEQVRPSGAANEAFLTASEEIID